MPSQVDKKAIQQAETALGVVFPDIYKQKMLLENGGELTVEYEEDDEEVWTLHSFQDKSGNVKDDIVAITTRARDGKKFPSNGVVIASDGSGDHLVLIPGIKNKTQLEETIYLWMHETGETAILIDDMAEMFLEDEDLDDEEILSFSQFADNDNVDSGKKKPE